MIGSVWSQAERARLEGARTRSRGLPRLHTPKALTVLHVRVLAENLGAGRDQPVAIQIQRQDPRTRSRRSE
jgi:hypothetical protein